MRETRQFSQSSVRRAGGQAPPPGKGQGARNEPPRRRCREMGKKRQRPKKQTLSVERQAGGQKNRMTARSTQMTFLRMFNFADFSLWFMLWFLFLVRTLSSIRLHRVVNTNTTPWLGSWDLEQAATLLINMYVTYNCARSAKQKF